MKLTTLPLLPLFAAMAALSSPLHADILVPWGVEWDFLHPTNNDNPSAVDPLLLPENDIIDLDFYSTWFLKDGVGPGTFDDYDGPAFSGPPVPGHYDAGTGNGPIGYATIDYFTSGDPELTGFGFELTTPIDGERRAAFFRTVFNVPAGGLGRPTLRYLLDDGAIVYIDGVLVARLNMAAGAPEAFATNASNATNTENTVYGPLDLSVQDTSTAGEANPTTVPNPVSFLAAGPHTLAVSVRSNTQASSDMCLAFELSATAAPVISASVSNVTRGLGALPGDPSDDDVSFSVTVTGNALPPATPGWTTTGGFPAVPVTGTYGTPAAFGPFPIASMPIIISFADRTDGTATTSITVDGNSLPPHVGINFLGVTPAYIQADPTSDSQWAVDGLTFTFTQNNGGATPLRVARSNPVAIPAGARACVTFEMEYEDTSTGTNAEIGDMLKIELETNAGTQNLIRFLDQDNNGFVNGNDNDPQDEFNKNGMFDADVFVATWLVSAVVPPGATTATIVISGNNDSATEIQRVRNIRFIPCVDTDGDGAYDSDEAVAGTNPADPASFFREISHTRGVADISITVPTVVTRRYQLLSSMDGATWLFEGLPVPGTGTNMVMVTSNVDQRKLVRVITIQ